MHTVADFERPSILFPAPRDDGRTLDDVLSGVWEDLVAHRAAACPICGGAMTPRSGSGPAAVGGACAACGTQLA